MTRLEAECVWLPLSWHYGLHNTLHCFYSAYDCCVLVLLSVFASPITNTFVVKPLAPDTRSISCTKENISLPKNIPRKSRVYSSKMIKKWNTSTSIPTFQKTVEGNNSYYITFRFRNRTPAVSENYKNVLFICMPHKYNFKWTARFKKKNWLLVHY